MRPLPSLRTGRLHLPPTVAGALVAISCGGSPNPFEGAPEPTTREAVIERLAVAAPRMLEHYDVPGAQVAVLQHGEIAWTAEYGVTDSGSGRPVQPRTRFNAGSISKVVTAWGVMRLVESGRIELDVPVNDYLVRWRVPDGPHDPEAVTVRTLLSHDSGLVFHGEGGLMGYDEGEALPNLVDVLEARPPANNNRVEWVAPPGSGSRYSAAGYTILQILIEDVSGASFSSFMDSEILEPLGMSGSSFGPDADEKEASGHNLYDQPYSRLRFAASGVAGFRTSATDLGQLLAATSEVGPLRGGASVLSEENWREMLKRQSGNDFTSFGFGYERQPTILGDRTRLDTVRHDGRNRGFAAATKLIHPSGDGIIILTNGDRGMLFATALRCAWIMPTSKIIRDERGVTEGAWPPGKCVGLFNQPDQWNFWTFVTALSAAIWTLVVLVQVLRRRRRVRLPTTRVRWNSALRLVGPLVPAAAWLVTLYTSWVASWVFGADGMIPFGVLGPGVHGLTLALVSLCVVASLSALFPKDPAFNPFAQR